MKKNIFVTVFFLTFFGIILPQSTSGEALKEKYSLLSSFRSFMEIVPRESGVPQVIEIPLPHGSFLGNDIAVLEKETGSFEPWYLKRAEKNPFSQSTITSNQQRGSAEYLRDNNIDTYAEYILPESGEKGTAEIIVTSPIPIEASLLTIELDAYVALPFTIEILSLEKGTPEVVYAKSYLRERSVYFPKTASRSWRIIFQYIQPLRITEFDLSDSSNEETLKGLRFLTRPKMTYEVYFDADVPTHIVTRESGNLADDSGVLKISSPSIIPNPLYKKADSDLDDIPNEMDNCVDISNNDQKDEDSNGRGDVCDDYDRDGLINAEDNCQDYPNRDQNDTDADGIGDICDTAESRITERLPWLPWAGIIVTGGIIGSMLFFTLRKP
ncbi:thrombospondin type 3 repeat-containing protein [Candidatus Peregrinibacteria bacterium]|nr:thrombospondin type 3 repeat-containing protein [Candidatus Peregrinibacteria bacterium]